MTNYISQISSIHQYPLNESLLTCWKTTGLTVMNRGGGVCPCYGCVHHSACLNSVKTFAREDEDSCGRMVTALSWVQSLHLHIAAPGSVTKECYLNRHLYWVRNLRSSLPKTNVFLLQQVCTPRLQTQTFRGAAVSVTWACNSSVITENLKGRFLQKGSTPNYFANVRIRLVRWLVKWKWPNTMRCGRIQLLS